MGGIAWHFKNDQLNLWQKEMPETKYKYFQYYIIILYREGKGDYICYITSIVQYVKCT